MPVKQCLLEGCEKQVHSRGLCPMHYQRKRKHGDTSIIKPTIRKNIPPIEKRIADKTIPVTETGCLLWLGAHQGRYGMVWYRGRMVNVHRMVWELHHGPIQKGLVIRHKCDVTMCCNIDHLQVGTQYENIQDKKKSYWNQIQ